MKRTLTLLFSLCVALLLFGCAGSEEPSGEAGTPSFNATVLEVYESGGCLVEPFADEEAVLRSADRLTLGGKTLEENGLSGLAVGDGIRIEYVRFLYAKGSVYRIENNNLLFHGAVPLDENGESPARCRTPD